MDSRIESRIGVRADAETIWNLIADLPGWDRWNPHETDVAGAIGYGGEIRLTERLPDLPERAVTGRVGDWQPLAQLIWTEKRGWLFNVVRYFEIEELAPGSCIVSNGIIFSGLRGEMFHDRHRKTIKAAYGEISERLRKLAEG